MTSTPPREFTGRDLVEALQLASRAFNVKRSQLGYELLEEGRRGFLGIGSRECVIRAWPRAGVQSREDGGRDEDRGRRRRRRGGDDDGGRQRDGRRGRDDRPRGRGRGGRGGDRDDRGRGDRDDRGRGGDRDDRGRGGDRDDRGRGGDRDDRGRGGDRDSRGRGGDRDDRGGRGRGGDRDGRGRGGRRGGGGGQRGGGRSRGHGGRNEDDLPARLSDRGRSDRGGHDRGRPPRNRRRRRGGGGRDDHHGSERGGGRQRRGSAPRSDAPPRTEPQKKEATVPATDSHAHEVHDLVEEIVTHWGLELDVDAEARDDTVHVDLTGGDANLLSEEDGKVLDALQYLVSKMVSRQMEDNIRVLLDAEGRRRARDEELREEARRMANEAKETGRKLRSAPLSAYERRVLHLAVAEEEGIRTFSVGRGHLKRVTIVPLQDDDEEHGDEVEDHDDEDVRDDDRDDRDDRDDDDDRDDEDDDDDDGEEEDDDDEGDDDLDDDEDEGEDEEDDDDDEDDD